MNSGKRISAWWNSLLCWLFDHSLTTICNRCGKFVDLEGTKRPTLEERINNYFKNRKERKLNPDKPLFKGSLKLKDGLKKYSINLLTNELRLVEYQEEKEYKTDKYGCKKRDKKGNPICKVTSRKAEYNPSCVYIDADNDVNAIRKANNYIRGVKRGVVITYVSTHDPKEKSITVKL
jgi:hypothetical protein